jgi:hypothetical protein
MPEAPCRARVNLRAPGRTAMVAQVLRCHPEPTAELPLALCQTKFGEVSVDTEQVLSIDNHSLDLLKSEGKTSALVRLAPQGDQNEFDDR